MLIDSVAFVTIRGMEFRVSGRVLYDLNTALLRPGHRSQSSPTAPVNSIEVDS